MRKIEAIKRKLVVIKNKINSENTIEEVYDNKNNSFDILRHIFATLVIVAHAYILFLGATGDMDIITKTLKTVSLGHISVIGFFVISGFLITQSMLNSKNYFDYFFKRILRIYPALIVAICLSAFVIGPLVTNLPWDSYLHSGVKAYVLNNLNLIGNTAYTIGDVFNSNPYPSAINGSLWTIKHEVAAYVMVALLSFFTILKHKKITLVLTLILFIVAILKPVIDFGSIGLKVGVLTEYKWFFELMFYFMLGTVMYLYKDKIIMSPKFFLLACIVFCCGIFINKIDIVIYFTFPYIVIYLSTLKTIFQTKKIGDFSYGLYIYAFPIQQLLVYYLKNHIHNIYVYILLSIICTLIVSVFSWFLVEKPFLSLKKKTLKDSKLFKKIIKTNL